MDMLPNIVATNENKSIGDHIEKLQREVGEIIGIQKMQTKTLDKISETLDKVMLSTATIDQIAKTTEKHGERLIILENKVAVNENTISKHEDHISKDTNIDSYINEKAKKILMICGGAFGAWLLTKLPHILAKLLNM